MILMGSFATQSFYASSCRMHGWMFSKPVTASGRSALPSSRQSSQSGWGYGDIRITDRNVALARHLRFRNVRNMEMTLTNSGPPEALDARNAFLERYRLEIVSIETLGFRERYVSLSL
jgi:hypothetical protein